MNQQLDRKKQMVQILSYFQKTGHASTKLAKQIILKQKNSFSQLQEALNYFMSYWNNPMHSTLIHLSSQAVGGKTDNSIISMGAALVLISGGADVHDDIIDKSKTKATIPTVYGKYGIDLSTLVGDVLLMEGTCLFHETIHHLPHEKQKIIINLFKDTFFEITDSEAKEASLKGLLDISESQYTDIIWRKVAASELATKIGAIMGGGSPQEIEVLGHYGRTFGYLMSIRDEFIDIFEPDELHNRFKNECLPLPILLAMTEDSNKVDILKLLESDLNEKNIEALLDIVYSSKSVQNLKKEFVSLINDENQKISQLKYCKSFLKAIITATTEDL